VDISCFDISSPLLSGAIAWLVCLISDVE